MSEGWIAFWAALGGAAMGAGAALVSAWVQQRGERRRELARLAFQAAIEDHRIALERANKRVAAGAEVMLPPLLVFIYHHWRVADLGYRGKLSPRALARLAREQKKLIDALKAGPGGQLF